MVRCWPCSDNRIFSLRIGVLALSCAFITRAFVSHAILLLFFTKHHIFTQSVGVFFSIRKHKITPKPRMNLSDECILTLEQCRFQVVLR